MQVVRDWILRWARLKAVVSLPQETFAPYGAGVKASVLFLEKREQALMSQGQLEIGQEITELDRDYNVYMARIDNIGYDANGRLTISEENASSPVAVQESIQDFSRKLGW
jgi:type I restriction enzyme M protein